MLPVVIATMAVLTFAALVVLFPATLAPKLAPALGVPTSLIGLQISLAYAGAMATSLVAGGITHRTGACRASQLALLLLGSGAALAAFPTIWTFALASVVMGLGYGMTNPAASHLLVRYVPAHRRSLVFSIKQTGVPLGGMLAGACAPALALMVGWQAALLSLTLLAVAGIVAMQSKRAAWDQDRVREAGPIGSPFAGVLLVWRHRPLRYISLLALCFSAVQLSLSAFTVTLLVEDLGVSLLRAGLIMSAVQIAGVIGRVAWGWAADRLGSGTGLLVLNAFITIAGTLTVPMMSPEWPVGLVAVVLCVFGFAALGWNGVYLAEVAQFAPSGTVAMASGGSLFFTFGGVLLGPPGFTALHALLGSYRLSFVALSVAAVLGLFCLLLARAAAVRCTDPARAEVSVRPQA